MYLRVDDIELRKALEMADNEQGYIIVQKVMQAGRPQKLIDFWVRLDVE